MTLDGYVASLIAALGGVTFLFLISSFLNAYWKYRIFSLLKRIEENTRRKRKSRVLAR
jgi:hypothetical protein